MKYLELVLANWSTALFFFALFLISTLIAVFELLIKNERKKKIAVLTMTALLVACTVSDFFFENLPREDWRPAQSVKKANELFDKEYDFLRLYSVDGIYSHSLGSWRFDLNKFSEEYKLKTGTNIIFSNREEQTGPSRSIFIYEYTFDDSSRFTVAFNESQQCEYFLYERALAEAFCLDEDTLTLAASINASMELSSDAVAEEASSISDSVLRVLEAIHNSEIAGSEITGEVGTFYADIAGLLQHFPSSTDESLRYSMKLEPDWETTKSDELQKMEQLAIYMYRTCNSIKIFFVPYITNDDIRINSLLYVESSNGESGFYANDDMYVYPGDTLQITVAISFLQDIIEGIHLAPSSVREASLHIDLPDNYHYISGSTTQAVWANDDIITESLPDGIATNAGLSMGTVMPDDDVKYVTFFVQINPFDELFANSNQAEIKAIISSGDNAIEQIITVNTISSD